MILQSLVSYYETLSQRGEISPPGWSDLKVSFALDLDAEGNLLRAIPLKTEQKRGKKTVLAPQLMHHLPVPVKRSSGISPNFLCDNSTYLLGIDNKGKPKRSKECFQACGALHQMWLEGMDSPAIRAVLAFFERWQPEQAASHPALQECMDEIIAGGNLVFMTPEGYLHEDPQACEAWERAYNSGSEGGPEGVCLVTGKRGPLEAVHPAIKNVAGAQSSGAALVSFNAPAFCSYNKEQNLNAPTGQYATFAYTTALNHLLADREHVHRVGDTTVVCWAAKGGSAYQNFLGDILLDTPEAYTFDELQKMVQSLCRGDSIEFEEEQLDPEMEFCILGLAPNAARLSVRFFLRDSFGQFLRNIEAHYQRLEIVRPSFDKVENIPVWKLLSETVNQNSRDKSPAPGLAGETLRAILMDARYPATLLNGVVLRIRAEHKITRGRAAIIKAYYLKNPHQDVPKEEVLTVSLNPDSKNIPYTLGRLFAVLEAIQSEANPGINATIKDKYFNSASSTPGHVFPVLINLAQKHMKKMKSEGTRIYYSKQVTAIMGILGESYPDRLSLPQQGSFQLGYYHQTQARFEKKEEK